MMRSMALAPDDTDSTTRPFSASIEVVVSNTVGSSSTTRMRRSSEGEVSSIDGCLLVKPMSMAPLNSTRNIDPVPNSLATMMVPS